MLKCNALQTCGKPTAIPKPDTIGKSIPPRHASLTPNVAAHIVHRDDAMCVVCARESGWCCAKQRGPMQARDVARAVEVEPDDTIRVFYKRAMPLRRRCVETHEHHLAPELVQG